MSHFTTIQTQIRDLEALNDACVEMGFKFVANANESRDLAALRDTLLPRLLSGEVEAPAAQELVAMASART